MATGFEQVRSVVAAIAGDIEAADRVELDLPETGVCGTATIDCCGGPAKTDASACCALDERKKTEGETGCGCGVGKPAVAERAPRATVGCCS